MFFKPKVLVTGGAGFIGSHQVDALLTKGFNVVVVDNLRTGKEEYLNKEAKFYNLDIRQNELSQVFKDEKPDFVFHFASEDSKKSSFRDPIFNADVNIIGALNVFENCIEHKVKKIICASSAVPIYGETEQIPTSESFLSRPKSPLGIAKSAMENYLRFYYDNYGLLFVVLRYANVYGPRQTYSGDRNVVAAFIQAILENKPAAIFGNGHQTRDFVYIDDVIRANMMALANRVVGVYNVGTGRQTTINELLQLVKAQLGNNGSEKFIALPAWPENSCLNIEKIKRDLNWKPEVCLEDGLARTIEWAKT